MARRFIDDLMAEVIRYGGLPVRRCDAYEDALRRLSSRWADEGISEQRLRLAAERFAFVPEAIHGVDPISREELERLP